MGNGRLASVDINRDYMAGARRTRHGQQRDPLSPSRPSPRQRVSDKRIVIKADDHDGTESQRPPRPRPRRQRQNAMIPTPQQRQSKLEESLARVQEWLRSCGDIAMEPDTCTGTWRWNFEQVSQTEATNFDGSIASGPGDNAGSNDRSCITATAQRNNVHCLETPCHHCSQFDDNVLLTHWNNCYFSRISSMNDRRVKPDVWNNNAQKGN